VFEDLVDLIVRRRVAFPPFGQGVSERAIKAAESALGLDLPLSYRWWLLNYGGGQIGGDLVYGLDEAGIGAPDLVQLNRVDLSDGIRKPHQVMFYIGNEERFFFDTNRRLESGEYPVCQRVFGEEDVDYADSFDDFLRRRIAEVEG
jgi:antitoxin YobK